MAANGKAPVIGITACKRPSTFGAWNIDAVIIPATYTNAVSEAGGSPLILPPGCCASMLDVLDGIVFSGGPDLHPSLYDQELDPHTAEFYPEQDESESALMRGAIERDIPLLGVCRGMQLMCILHGGSMHQHLPETAGHEEHGGWNGVITEHGVNMVEGTRLAAILGDHVTANSTHHQGVDDPGTLRVSARSSHDDLIEAVERDDLRFCLGVQWHPERIGHIGLYRSLVEAARGS